MILTISSPNPNLLDLLFKNPDTDDGLYFKPLKNGIVVGNAVNAHKYEVVFQDTKYSYLPEDSNQIDFQSYCGPLVVLQVCNELFGHLLKEKSEYLTQEISWLGKTQGEIDTYPCEIEIPTFYIHSNWYRDGIFLLGKYFPELQVTHTVGRNFRLKISARDVFDAFNLLNLVSLFTHITNEYGMFTFIDDSFAAKYMRVLTNISNVPYFVFYLFIKRAVKSDKQFSAVKPVFEKYLAERGIEANLTYYNTHLNRVHFISSKLALDVPILDIGCGEFIYYKRMMKLGFKHRYYAVDTDPIFERMAENMLARYEEENLLFYNTLEAFENRERVNILLTEVIEHNSLEDAKTLIRQALTYNFNDLFITTPNSEFNIHYTDSDDMRHDDHHFELTHDAFKKLIEESVDGKEDITITYAQIGDTLNGIQPTQACIIHNNN